MRVGFSSVEIYWRSAFWLVASCGLCCGQNDPAVRLANQVRSDVAALAAGGTLGSWRSGHLAETVKAPNYVTQDATEENESPFTRGLGKCSISIGSLPGQVRRTASFYVPLVKPGKLPPLPSQMDRTLTRRCELDEFWYTVQAPIPMELIRGALESMWGKANGQSEEMAFGGSSLWPDVVAWHREGLNVWVIPHPSYPNRDALGSAAIFVRRTGMPEVSDLLSYPDRLQPMEKAIGEESARELAGIAGLEPSLSAQMVSRASCAAGNLPKEDVALLAERLGKWLNAAKALTPLRRAAALLLADEYMSCIDELPDAARERFIALGAEFNGGCAEDGGEYGHSFRKEAEKLDPNGRVGAWGQLADLWTYCAVEDPKFVARAERLLLWFPKWRPMLHFLLGRAHGTRLAFAFPGGFPNDGAELQPLSPAAQQRERLAAVRAYRSFVQETPDDANAVFAWQEAWRLLAGLEPGAVEFGCTCE